VSSIQGKGKKREGKEGDKVNCMLPVSEGSIKGLLNKRERKKLPDFKINRKEKG